MLNFSEISSLSSCSTKTMFDQQVLKLQSKTLKEYDSRMQEDWYDLEMKSPRVIWRALGTATNSDAGSSLSANHPTSPSQRQLSSQFQIQARPSAIFSQESGVSGFLHLLNFQIWDLWSEILTEKCDIYHLTCLVFQAFKINIYDTRLFIDIL